VRTRTRNPAAVLLGGLCAAVWLGSANADGPHKLDTVEVIGHYENGIGMSDSASQGTVTAKLIESRPVLRPAEVLEFIPGVIITQHSGDGKANQYFLRGFNLDHGTDFAVSVAGMPVNMPSHAHGQGYSDLNFLIPELVQRIDYRKGPYFAEEGDFASAGAANIHLENSLKEHIASLSLGQDRYRRGLFAGSNAFANGKLLYALELGGADGPWINPEDLRKTNFVGRYSLGTREQGMSLTAMAYQARWNATDQIPKRAVAGGLVSRFGAIDASDGGETARSSLSYDVYKKNAQGFTQFNAYAIHYRLNLFSNFTYFLDDPVNGDQFEQADRRNVFGLSGSKSWYTQWGGREIENKVGLAARRDNIGQVGLYATLERTRLSTTREDRVRQTSAGLYFENTVQWSNRLRSIAGVRADTYRFDVDSNNPANSGNRGASIGSPKLALIFGPWSKTEFFVNAGTGFHSNDGRGATITVDPRSGAPADRVTPLVKSRGAELGARTEIVPGLQSSLALWQLALASELVFAGDAGSTQAGRPSRRHGVEWNNHYIARSWLLFDLDLSASSANFTDSDPAGNQVPGAVDKVASFGVTVTELGPWFGSLQWRYFGPRPLIEDNSRRSQATSLANLRVGYAFTKNAKVTLDLFNLFNRTASDVDYFYTSRLRGEPAAGVDDIHFHPVEPRRARLTATLKF